MMDSSCLSPPDPYYDEDEERQSFLLKRRSRSNSIAAGAIARLKNLPEIKLSLPPDETSTGGVEMEDPQHEEEKDLESNSSLLLAPNHSSSRKLLLKNKPLEQLKVLDQRDLNLKPDAGQNPRRNSLPISDSLSPTRFLNTRRLSHVSSVVSAQIQSTIGWPRTVVSEEDIADQAKCLAAKFVWLKLRKNGFCHRRYHLQRLRSVCNFGENEEMDKLLNQVVTEIKLLSRELELLYPKLFISVRSQVGPVCFSSIQTVTKTQMLVGRFLFSCNTEISWPHVVAFFQITAALALDSVIIGHHDFVLPLIDSFAEFVASELAPWISQEGGWDSIINKYREEDEWMKKFRWILILFALIILAIIIVFVF